MLIGIDPLLGPDLLSILRAMGHGDELVIADANFPSAAVGRRVVRADGISATRMLEAVTSVLPLDTFVPAAAFVMELVGHPGTFAPIADEFREILSWRATQEPPRIDGIERFAFYERARQAFAVVATGELRIYGNIILRKGIIKPGGKWDQAGGARGE
jgi:L-fucose mutarotase